MTRVSGETALGLAWVTALTASLAVLFIGEVLGQTPCLLCWFQRAFMFPLAIILGLGLWWRDRLPIGQRGGSHLPARLEVVKRVALPQPLAKRGALKRIAIGNGALAKDVIGMPKTGFIDEIP